MRTYEILFLGQKALPKLPIILGKRRIVHKLCSNIASMNLSHRVLIESKV